MRAAAACALSGAGRQDQISFDEFVHAPYPVGLGATYDTIRGFITNPEHRELLILFDKASERPSGNPTGAELDRRRGEIEFSDAARMTRALSDECRLANERLVTAARGEPNFTLQGPSIAMGETIDAQGEG